MRLAVVGDALLDRDVEGDVERLAPDAPVPVVDERSVVVRAGGAGLAATLAAGDGNVVVLVTALAGDGAGRELRGALEAAGVEVVDGGLEGTTPEKIRIRARDRALLRLDRGGTDGAVGAPGEAGRAALAGADAILVADYGRGMAAAPPVRDALDAAVAEGVPVVWDPHPRGPAPVAGVALATPNAPEARAACDGAPSDVSSAGHAALLREAWRAAAVCVTRGADGAVLVTDDAPLVVPAPAVPVGDPCGAGDRFASRAAEVLGRGGSVQDAVRAAVDAASRFVAAGGAAAVGRPRDGEVLVATGGCFDLLHPGHVATLRAARALGDRLVVCLNSDASVRRLKGPGRPVNAQADRVAMLEALACVDQVVVFDEDTPTAVLERLRPDVWAKGGDYAVADLPEAEALARWGGRVVILPHVDGRSTTRLIEEVTLHVA